MLPTSHLSFRSGRDLPLDSGDSDGKNSSESASAEDYGKRNPRHRGAYTEEDKCSKRQGKPHDPRSSNESSLGENEGAFMLPNEHLDPVGQRQVVDVCE